MRTKPCACGGWIVVPSRASVTAAVQQHNASLSHVIWRYIREFVPRGKAPTATVRLCDVSLDGPRASGPSRLA